ncbi:MAG: hypothetical protein LUH63_03760 [Parabacteroides sp.]|nr:hypothetical protein [Parabacteroides sp.]
MEDESNVDLYKVLSPAEEVGTRPAEVPDNDEDMLKEVKQSALRKAQIVNNGDYKDALFWSRQIFHKYLKDRGQMTNLHISPVNHPI